MSRRQWPRRPRAAEEAEADFTFRHDVVGPLFNLELDAADTLPPAVQIGWIKRTVSIGEYVVCLRCSSVPPTPSYTPVYEQSVFRQRLCCICGRVLDAAAE